MFGDSDIDRVAAAFMDRSLPRDQWTHEAHFAVALWLLRHRPGTDMAQLIRAYNEALSTRDTDSSGYHETITRASLVRAGTALDAAGDRGLGDVLAALMAGPCGQAGWLMTHWRRETLFSPAARYGWVPPDLAPL